MRKTKIAALVLAALLLLGCLSSCSAARTLEVDDESVVLHIVAAMPDYTIYVHEATGVWYIAINGRGGATVMVNTDGTPYTGG